MLVASSRSPLGRDGAFHQLPEVAPMQTTLRIIAGVLAVASLLGTIFFVHDRRQRVRMILLSTGLIVGIVGPLFRNSAIQIAAGWYCDRARHHLGSALHFAQSSSH